jgi:hypothetical protein
MTKDWLLAALLRIYPTAWRREYGEELTGILVGRPLTPRVIADVIWNGLWQRGRVAEPSTILGLVSMFVTLAGLVVRGVVLRPSSMTFPTVRVTLLTTEFYVLLIVGCGCWTYLRHGDKVTRSGVAAMRMSLIAGIPALVIGLLMMFGFLDVIVGADGAAGVRKVAWAILIARLAQVPEAWIWGSIGGLIGKWIARRRTAAAS